jgi:hypothetical protein
VRRASHELSKRHEIRIDGDLASEVDRQIDVAFAMRPAFRVAAEDTPKSAPPSPWVESAAVRALSMSTVDGPL